MPLADPKCMPKSNWRPMVMLIEPGNSDEEWLWDPSIPPANHPTIQPSVHLSIYPSLSGHAPPAGSSCLFVLVSADLVIDSQRSLISVSRRAENAGGKCGWLEKSKGGGWAVGSAAPVAMSR